ncbi:methyl-CpG-binding domain-containing protein 11-like [Phoenix dactylifera]|uniref:Methyl-CpG-binding domain-containing protein 11-like n=1 Tax=Phoenix dactylifera TaxID=42345 RepID=A0A8B7D5R0_PHODC|nr:methyl-CpG-binding domain-containing protein 11-like [Phoenix dactylifera]
MAANYGEKKAVEESPAEKERGAEEVVSVELPAPPGWRKKFMLKKGGTPHRNEIVFISPTGEEVKNKRQLDIYLRSHAGNPSSSEFDWGTGDTPRRSARISEKAKATATPEGEKPKKRERKSSSKKGGNKDKDSDVVDAKVEDTRAFDGKMKEAEDGEDKSKEEVNSVEIAVKEGAVGQAPLDDVKEKAEGKSEELEESSKVDPAAAVPEEGDKEEKPETEKLVDAEKLPPATDKKEEASAETEMDRKVPENGTHKDNEASVPKDAPSVTCDDGQHQPQASPVNC